MNNITQCGNTVYIGIAVGVPALYEIPVFYFQNTSFGDITVENMLHTKIRSKENVTYVCIDFTILSFFFLKMRNSMTLMAVNMKVGVSTGFRHR